MARAGAFRAFVLLAVLFAVLAVILIWASNPPDTRRNVVIIGGGVSGMVAAIQAEKLGCRVSLVDGNVLGGDGGLFSEISGFRPGVEADSEDLFLDDLVKAGQAYSDYSLVKKLAAGSAGAFEFLESIGIKFDGVKQYPGHSASRTWTSVAGSAGDLGVGQAIVAALKEHIAKAPGIVVHEGRHADNFVVHHADGQNVIRGVGLLQKGRSQDRRVWGDAFILANGGFGDNEYLVHQYMTGLKGVPSVSEKGNQGHAIMKLCKDAGADFVNLDSAHIHATCTVDEKDPVGGKPVPIPQELRLGGAVLLNHRGKRFVNEMALEKEVVDQILAGPSFYPPQAEKQINFAYLVADEDVFKTLHPGYAKTVMGLFTEYLNADVMAENLGIVKEDLYSTLSKMTPGDDKFGNTALRPLRGKIYATMVTPAIMSTLGGVQVSPHGEVLGMGGKLAPIRNLFAAGEAAGGVHGKEPLSGTNLLESIVFGLNSATNAASRTFVPTPKGIEHLEQCLGELEYVVGPENIHSDIDRRNAAGAGHGHLAGIAPDAVVSPVSVAQAAAVVKVVMRYGINMIPLGMGTSLDGHVGAVLGGISVDMTSVNEILAVDRMAMVVKLEAGVRKKQLLDHLEPQKLTFPVDPQSNPTFGGMISTGASGTTTVRYGTIRKNFVSLKVALPTGEILDTAPVVKKSSAGYDINPMYAGAEGTLGLILEATVKIIQKPESLSSVVVPFVSIYDATQAVVDVLNADVPVLRVEIINGVGIEAFNGKYGTDLPEHHSLFFDFIGGDESNMDIVHEIADRNHAIDWRQAATDDERDHIWAARRNAYHACINIRAKEAKEEGKNIRLYVSDTVVPLDRLADMVYETEQDFVENSFLVAPLLGHIGDGNFHLNVPVDMGNATEVAELGRMKKRLVARANRLGGVSTGEHGIGWGKLPHTIRDRGVAAINTMYRIKKALDPQFIMNPGKVFVPPEDLRD